MFAIVALAAVVLAASAAAFEVDGNSTLAGGAFDINQAKIALWLSAAAYCGKENYKTHVFQGPTKGFVYSSTIEDHTDDTQGYVGYLPSDKSIYVVYRGSQTIRNWATNLDAWKTPYTTYSSCNCQVHKGFYEAEQAVIKSVVNSVKSLRSKFPSYSVKLAGHSLGAALAHLTSMDLLKSGYTPASVYTFGQPRTGDKAYSNFASPKVPTWRVTHNKDMVPHLPLETGMDYFHVCSEKFEDASGNLKSCNGCEDSKCADQYPVEKTNIDDHLIYLGLGVNCDAVSK